MFLNTPVRIAMLMSLLGAGSAGAQTFLSEPFDYAPGAAIEEQAPTIWKGRYDLPDTSAVASDGKAQLYTWRTLTSVSSYTNLRDTVTRISADIDGAGAVSYNMDAAVSHGVHISVDAEGRVVVESGNRGALGKMSSQAFEVTTASGLIHVELYLIDQYSQVFITDDLGTQATPYWFNEELFGNNDYHLVLGYGGRYDNIELGYDFDPLPLADAPRTPVVVTESLIEGAVDTPYSLITPEWMMAQGLTLLQQIRADGGVPPLSYTVTSGSLPAGVAMTTRLIEPTDDGSPAQWVSEFEGTPAEVGDFPFTVTVQDAVSQTTTEDYTLVVTPPGAPTVAFSETFTGADGVVIHDTPGSQWTGRYGADRVSATYLANQAKVNSWKTLEAFYAFRNADSRWLHVGGEMFAAGGMALRCAGTNYGVTVAYNGTDTITIRSNNLSYAPQRFQDVLAVTTGADGKIGVDIYVKGQESRVYITDAGGQRATDVYTNSRFCSQCQNGDMILKLGYKGVYDNVIGEDVAELPELINPVQVVTQDILRAYEGVGYRDTLAATSGKEPYTWSGSGLPAGMGVAPDGVISGTALPGEYPALFTVTDAVGQQAELAVPVLVEADPAGTLLFADRFTLPAGLKLVERDGAHWSSLAHTAYALEYQQGAMEILGHKQAYLVPEFANDGATPLSFRWTMTKGMAQVFQVGTCYGMKMTYDGLQRVSVQWNDMGYEPYMEQQDFLLYTNGEVIDVTIQVLGDELALRVQDSQNTYIRGPYQAWRMTVGEPVCLGFHDNTPYGEGRYNSYQAGPSHIDDVTVREDVWDIVDGSPLRDTEKLGELLFFDPILSGNDQRACASCHLPSQGFGDGLTKAEGLSGATLSRNTPSLVNLALQGAFFHDGREADLNQVALQPLVHVEEMGQDLASLEAELSTIPEYVDRFNALWADGVTAQNVSTALGVYLKTLMELRTAADENNYRQGTLTADQDAGFILFEGKAGCFACHSLVPVNEVDGVVYDDPLFKVLGVPTAADGAVLDTDPGRAAVTGLAADQGSFRVPGLRNLTRTAPYMHNGAFDSLEQVVAFYNAGGGAALGLNVPNQAVEIAPLGLTALEEYQLIEFLKALSPDYPNHVDIPASVPSGLTVVE